MFQPLIYAPRLYYIKFDPILWEKRIVYALNSSVKFVNGSIGSWQTLKREDFTILLFHPVHCLCS